MVNGHAPTAPEENQVLLRELDLSHSLGVSLDLGWEGIWILIGMFLSQVLLCPGFCFGSSLDPKTKTYH